jgi:hypothetical protein
VTGIGKQCGVDATHGARADNGNLHSIFLP